MNNKHIIWDYNGTILDDVDLGWQVMVKILKNHDMPTITRNTYKKIIGFPIIDYYEKAGFDFNIYPFSDLADEFIYLYNKNFHLAKLQKDVQDTLKYFKGNGFVQSILTAGSQESIIKQLKFFEIFKYFSCVSGLDNHHAAGKIELAPIHMKCIGREPYEVVFIGDTMHDLRVAHAIPCECILVSFGHQNRERLESVDCEIADNYDYIKAFVHKVLD